MDNNGKHDGVAPTEPSIPLEFMRPLAACCAGPVGAYQLRRRGNAGNRAEGCRRHMWTRQIRGNMNANIILVDIYPEPGVEDMLPMFENSWGLISGSTVLPHPVTTHCRRTHALPFVQASWFAWAGQVSNLLPLHPSPILPTYIGLV